MLQAENKQKGIRQGPLFSMKDSGFQTHNSSQKVPMFNENESGTEVVTDRVRHSFSRWSAMFIGYLLNKTFANELGSVLCHRQSL